MNTYAALLSVFIGGGLGSVARYAMSLGLKQWPIFGARGHWATFVVNLFASAALVWILKNYEGRPGHLLILATGFCGGWSTFSTFSVEAAGLLQSGRTAEAVLYVVASVCITAIVLVMMLLAQR